MAAIRDGQPPLLASRPCVVEDVVIFVAVGKHGGQVFEVNLIQKPVPCDLSDVEVSHRLKLSRRTLQEYRDSGIVPYIKLGGKVLYRERDLEELLERCYHPAYKS